MGKAVLLLEDGTVFHGQSLGAEGEAFGEVVFNTSITGYQEVLTDPSYRGQIVTMTYPLIGNYGMVPGDSESRGAWLTGFAVREASALRSNWRSTTDLPAWLREQKVVGIQGIDTRALTRHLRINGSKHGVVSSADLDVGSLARRLEQAPRIVGRDLVGEVSCTAPYEWTEPAFGDAALPEARYRVVVIDCGVKYNILRRLVSSGCQVTVVPATTQASEILSLRPDGVVLSNGPGDPEPLSYAIKTTRSLIGKRPIFGICLGQQILGLALGGRTYKLKFGHHGGNHPVKDIATGRIAITTQNHGFNVDMDSIAHPGTRATHVNLYDGTTEGLENRDMEFFSVQYHPEASPGPHDASYLFSRFTDMMGARKGA
ncbi:MAG TPA: glutamine-hydrolyzing carbamoyl-phosphate synthase small subunit [Spirochaetia bacterium]|nr:glutamine-hydrolyzing carbamoyl-phosphate synthase small subunit [Spirochaetia bacterium]